MIPGYRTLLREVPAFRWLWASRALSAVGDAAQFVALFWLASRAEDSAVWVGLIGFVVFVPATLIGPLAGAVVDRVNRRTLLLVADGVRAGLVALIPAAFLLFGLPAVFVLVVVDSLLDGLRSAAYFAAIPDVVGEAYLVPTNGLNATTTYAADVVGAALGGLLIALGNLLTPFWINAVTFLISGLLLLGIARERFHPTGEAQVAAGYVLSLTDGFRYARERKPVLLFILVGIIATVGFAPAPVALALLADEALDVGSTGYGVLQGFVAIGLAAGAVLAGHVARGRPQATVMALGYGAMGLATLLLGLAPTLSSAAVLVVLRSACNSLATVPGTSLLQTLVPSAYRGRVFALMRAAQDVPRAIILPLSGWLADLAGVRAVYAGMALAILAAGVVAYCLRGVLEPRREAR